VIASPYSSPVNTGGNRAPDTREQGRHVAAGTLRRRRPTMCANGLNGLIRMGRMTPQETSAATPATTLIAHLGLETKAGAEIQDLYSRPIRTTPVVPLVTGEHRAPRVPTADAA
jgi:hypothetical protein